MTVSLPTTSKRAYLTGTAAISIPMDDGHASGWHFDAAFLHEGTRFRIAGHNILDTYPLLGDFGIRECSGALTRRSVPLSVHTRFYAANAPRAVLDLLLDTTAKHQRTDFIAVGQLFEADELPVILERLATIRNRISDQKQLTLIDQWITRQQNALTWA